MRLLSWLSIFSNTPTSAMHTPSSVLKKLDSDLSDSKRKKFIKELLSSPHTHQLLDQTNRLWQQKLGMEEADLTQINMKAHQTSLKRYQRTITLFGVVQTEIRARDAELRVDISEPTNFRGERR